MKRFLSITVLIFGAFLIFSPSAQAAETPVSQAQGEARWSVIDGAKKYNVYYRESGNSNWTHSLWTGTNSTSVTISHLDPHVSYTYRVAALVDTKEVWQAEQTLYTPPAPVLGTYDELEASEIAPDMFSEEYYDDSTYEGDNTYEKESSMYEESEQMSGYHWSGVDDPSNYGSVANETYNTNGVSQTNGMGYPEDGYEIIENSGEDEYLNYEPGVGGNDFYEDSDY